jgi:hypothetical protein
MKNQWFVRACCLLPIVLLSAAAADELPILVTEDFEQDRARWHALCPKPSESVWKLVTLGEGPAANRALRVTGKSNYQPPHRSPHSVALLGDTLVGDFELTARVQNTNPSAGGHRDLCVFWGYQDAAHFYYVHLGAIPDPHSCQIFIVNDAPRTKITEKNSGGTAWDDGWHDIKVVRRVADGTMEVYFDDMETPAMTARDRTFAWGQVGLGTFDDSGNFDNLQLRGVRVTRPTADASASADASLVEARETDGGAEVLIDGKPFVTYVTRSGHQPALWPVYGPGGAAMTRSFPLGPLLPHEHDDHPHHRSIWFAHGDVNGYDFWLEPDSAGKDQPNTQIVHRRFAKVANAAGQAMIVTENDWMVDDQRLFSDVRNWTFGVEGQQRWIELEIELIAHDKPIAWGDTKEGTFSVRVAGTMKVDEKLGGRIINSEGQIDADAWGQPAAWVDYTGPVGEQTLGIAMLSHPSNFRPNCRWHVRTYGLFAANPFGNKDFPPGEPAQGTHTIPAGKSLKLRYRIVIHPADTASAGIADVYEKWTRSAP